MQTSQLPQAEQTKCIGWLLYSAPKYNMRDLQKQIKQVTGIDTTLHFRAIQEIRPTQDNSNKPQTKAIHIDVDQYTSSQSQQHIKRIYSPKAQTFPCGIKMWLVPFGNSADVDNAIKAAQLISLQAQFLVHKETKQICSTGLELHNKL